MRIMPSLHDPAGAPVRPTSNLNSAIAPVQRKPAVEGGGERQPRTPLTARLAPRSSRHGLDPHRPALRARRGLYFTLLGAALGRWLRLGWAPVWGMAPALGWGVFSALSFPLQDLFRLHPRIDPPCWRSRPWPPASASWCDGRTDSIADAPRLPPWVFALAAAVALIPLVGLLPRPADGGIIVGSTAFDHSKIAMVDEMTRLGLPAGNPFFGAGGARGVLSYYYLWHFGAAQLSILAGVTGWEADAAMTGVTAYASLVLMMGLAARLSVPAEGRGGARPAAAAVLGRAAQPRRLRCGRLCCFCSGRTARTACCPPTGAWRPGPTRRAGCPSTWLRPAAWCWRCWCWRTWPSGAGSARC